MEQLDKAAIGQRIKHLRKTRGMRQWQMAELLGATQPAIHKYENGILPEVKRLLELSRIGNTSVEWILTGHHWENGSDQMERLQPEVFDLAGQIHSFNAEERQAVGAALEILQAASRQLQASARGDLRALSDQEIGRMVRSFDAHILEPLMTALSVYDAVVTTLARARVREMHAFTNSDTGDGGDGRESGRAGVPDPGLRKNAS